ncbi:MAG: 3-dehydroquinate dehydratase / shikimate dehydrogenase [Blastocatellia bacterium]|nr:3-dehydroquinate dehydratase / shikimate dehydrogenase [Blastocatellia bacterium]
MKENPPKICVPVCVQHASELGLALERAAELADIVEARLDYLDNDQHDAAFQLLRHHLNREHAPMILTFRPAEEGGRAASDYEARRGFWVALKMLTDSDLMDLELDLVQGFDAETASIDWSRVICSHHDFSGVPSDLDQVYERMAATPARILKLAVQANDATDCLPIFHLLQRAQREGRQMIAIAMGQAGIMTRILGPSRGSFLTYGALADECATAPGQLTARDLREVYRIDKVNQETKIIGLMGNPVAHSLSPQIHNAAFAVAEINAVYLPFEVGNVGQFMQRLAHPRSRELDWNLHGLSVTAPHKTAVMQFLDWIDPAARGMGAVNTIVVRGDELHGYNTDALGFTAPLRHRFGSLRDARCAIVGAGGSARAALWALRNEGARVSLFVRDPDKARELSEEFEVDIERLTDTSFAGFDIVVNATPLGTLGVREHETVATVDQFRGVRLAYDLVYNPLETQFLREARAAGSETLGGIEMLLAQAVEQFKIWIGNAPDVDVMRAAAVRTLS